MTARPRERRAAGVVVALAALMLLALELRVTAVLGTEVWNPIRDDAAEYAAYAWNLREHGVYSRLPTWQSESASPPAADALRPPGYALLIAPLLDGPPDRAFSLRVGLLQAVLGALVVGLSFLLGRSLGGTLSGLATALLTALSPQLVTATHYVLTEVPFALVVTAVPLAAAAALAAAGRRAVAWWFACGVLLGATMLLRGTLLYFAPVAAAAALVMARRSALAAALALLAGATLAYGLWPLRNMAAGLDDGSTIALNSIHHGSYPRFMFAGRIETFAYPYRADPARAASTASAAALMRHIGAAFARDPLTMTRWYLAEKPVFLFGWEPIQGVGEVFVYPVRQSPYLESAGLHVFTLELMRAAHWPLVTLSFIACILGWRALSAGADAARAAALRFAIVLYLFVIALHVVAAPFPRYSIPFRPLSYALAMVAIVEIGQRLRLLAARWRRA